MRAAVAASVLSFGGFAATAYAQDPVTVGGAPMYADKNIVENAVNSKDHTTLVTAVKAADLVETLQGDGPFTFSLRPMTLLASFRTAPSRPW
jgi:uncharacterized surface protein with fasciclin (FAS1) repeats